MMFATTAILATAIVWLPEGDSAQAAALAWSPAPFLCDVDCRCTVRLGNEIEETSTPACYDETTMTVLNSTPGCCDGCDFAEDCSWTVEITVTNSSEEECCYKIIKDGIPPALYSNSCADSFNIQDSDDASCGSNHLYTLRAEGAECPHDPDNDCLKVATSVLVWSQRIHCDAAGMDCP